MYAPRSMSTSTIITTTTTRSTGKRRACAALTLLILASSLLLSTAALKADRQRRRNILSGGAAGRSEPNEPGIVTSSAVAVAIPDQVALAASLRPATLPPNQQRRGGYASSSGPEGDFTYSNLELNLVRPESEPLHTQITAKYTSAMGAAAAANAALDEAETAEEYVAKAMQMAYGARLSEPLRIAAEPEIAQHQQQQQRQQQQLQRETEQANQAVASGNYDFYNYAQGPPQPEQSQGQQPEQPHAQYQQPDVPQQQQQQQQQQEQQQQHQQEQPIDPIIDPQQFLELKLQAQLKAQQFADQQQQQSPQQQPQQQQQQQQSQAGPEHPSRSYEVYDESASNEGSGSAAQQVERYYRSKYAYQPANSYRGVVSEADAERIRGSGDELRVSASTEIPKAEIMKQIEKSVIRYMKELEAEGKIITAPQEPKTYYKMVTVPVEEQHSVSTVRPKYTTVTGSYHGAYHGGATSPAPVVTRHHSQHQSHGSAKHYAHKAHYQTETEAAYQAPASSNAAAAASHHHQQQQQHASAAAAAQQEMSDALAPNVEFIYKIKTRAPLQTATVKTVSKPYTLPLKATYGQFDHSAALKNLEDFDLSHVVTQEPDERPAIPGAGGKPGKLYFNSDVYQDINSLPYKPEKSRPRHAGGDAVEYRKVKAPSGSEMQPEYRGYSGYFAEPAPDDHHLDKEVVPGAGSGEDGYPIMNPYQFVLKKRPTAQSGGGGGNHYDDERDSWDQPRAAGPQTAKQSLFAAISAQKAALEYDSYNPKFNNNPEGYGYQHAYKSHSSAASEALHAATGTGGGGSHKYAPSRHHSSNGGGGSSSSSGSGGGGKRGKRGNGVQHANKKGGTGGGVRVLKSEIEANLALRPPPKQKV